MVKYFLNLQYSQKNEAKAIDNRCWWDPKAKSWWTNAEHSPLIQMYGLKKLEKEAQIIVGKCLL